MTRKRSRIVRRGADRKVSTRTTRWRPTLLHDQFLEGWAGVIPPGYSATGFIDASLTPREIRYAKYAGVRGERIRTEKSCGPASKTKRANLARAVGGLPNEHLGRQGTDRAWRPLWASGTAYLRRCLNTPIRKLVSCSS